MGLSDDVLYLALLVASIGLGPLIRRVEDPNRRKWLSTLSGLTLVLLVSGYHALFCWVAYALQLVCLWGLPWRVVHTMSFALQMAFLFFFRLCHWFGLPNAPAHTNAIQMMLALKLIGLAFEVHDTGRWESEREKNAEPDQRREQELQLQYRGVHPSLLDTFHYSFGHAGVMTGPYFKFRTFVDMYRLPFSQRADCIPLAMQRIARVPIFMALFLLSGYLFPLKDVEDESFYTDSSLLYRLFYMTPVFFNFRMRLYTGFILSECSCIMAGLGLYPKSCVPKPGHGPSNLQKLDDSVISDQGDDMDYETVHNIDEYGADFAPTMREALKTWNMTVQYWLVSIVYRRFPWKPLRTMAVMIVSSMWHGVHSGYYLSLGSVPLVLLVEDLYERIIRRQLSQKGQVLYDWFSWLYRMQQFSYLGMAFQLLRIKETLQFWHSIMYVGHLVLPLLYALGVGVLRPLFQTNSATERQKTY